MGNSNSNSNNDNNTRRPSVTAATSPRRSQQSQRTVISALSSLRSLATTEQKPQPATAATRRRQDMGAAETRIRNLERELEKERKAHAETRLERDQLRRRLGSEASAAELVRDKLATARGELEKATAEVAVERGRAVATAAELAACRAELDDEKANSGLVHRLVRQGFARTPRALILMTVAHRALSEARLDDGSETTTTTKREEEEKTAEEKEAAADEVKQELTRRNLDTCLPVNQAMSLLDKLQGESSVVHEILNSAELVQCHMCLQVKLGFKGPHALDEFPSFPNRLQPTDRLVCYSCRLSSITKEFDKHAFGVYEPGHIMERVRHSGDMARILFALEDPQLNMHERMFGRCMLVRKELTTGPNALSRKDLEFAQDLHLRMVRSGHMRSILHDDFSILDKAARSSELTRRTLNFRYMEVQTSDAGHAPTIPVLQGLFHKKARALECPVCLESATNIELISRDAWSKVCGETLNPEWINPLLAFPSRDILPETGGCAHLPDTCRSCLERHISTQLEVNGRQGVDRIGCPTIRCDRVYDYMDIRHLASREVFTIYDRYRFLNLMGNEPLFMWCLGPGCENGQMYTHRQRRVECETCKFAMCFRHQVPWHEGKTCDEYTRTRDYGSEEGLDGDSHAWFRDNAKRCPKCRVAIEKNEGCNHMSCTGCGHEFCWLCLLDWDNHGYCGEEGAEREDE